LTTVERAPIKIVRKELLQKGDVSSVILESILIYFLELVQT